MKKYDAIILGAGQSGPSLANRLTQAGKKVAILERLRFGGTCVNNGCTPTKALMSTAKAAHTVRKAKDFGILVEAFHVDMPLVKKRKDGIVHQSAEGVEKWLRKMENCTVYEGHGFFLSAHQIRVGSETIEGEQIFINVGGRAAIPSIPGLEKIKYLTNSSMMEIDYLPEHLLIVGGGYIALEFAQMYRRFGSQVTIFQRQPHLMPKEDEDVSNAIREIIEGEGIEVLTETKEMAILPASRQGAIHIEINHQGKQKKIKGSHLLLAAGRVPNTQDLGLENAGVERDEKGFIKVDERLRTTQPHIWAMGDCNGRGAFTHTSYNDYEIVAENLLDGGTRSVNERISIYALFIDPPLGRVGMTEKEAKTLNHKVLMATMPMTRVARAREKGETAGFLKILVNAETKLILGASLLGTDCDEVVQLIADIIYAKSPYTTIQKGVHIHPTVSELLPTLLSELKPV